MRLAAALAAFRPDGPGLGVSGTLALTVLAAVACRPVNPETRFLGFDPESSAAALSQGWSGWERSPEEDSFVWAVSRTPSVVFESRAEGDVLLRFRAWPFRFAGAPPQTATVFLNEARLEALTLGDGPRVYSVPVPEAALRRGANELRFELGYAEPPRDRMPGSSDARTLSAAFDWIELAPLAPKRPGG